MTKMYADEEIQDLAASYALGVLSDEEKAEFEAMLKWDSRASFHLEYFREITEDLAYNTAPLEEPQGLERRLFKYTQKNK